MAKAGEGEGLGGTDTVGDEGTCVCVCVCMVLVCVSMFSTSWCVRLGLVGKIIRYMSTHPCATDTHLSLLFIRPLTPTAYHLPPFPRRACFKLLLEV